MGNVALKLNRYYPNKREIEDLRPKEKTFMSSVQCSRIAPCGNVACVACGLATKAWFIAVVNELFSKINSKLDCVSLIQSKLIFGGSELNRIDIKKCARKYRDLVRNADPSSRIWVGAIDVSYNVQRSPIDVRQWCVHAMLITTALETAERTRLKELLPATELVSRPRMIKSVYDLNGIADYTFKHRFVQRERYFDSGGNPRVVDFELKGTAQSQFMYRFQDVPHTDRLITIGCRRQGNTLRIG